MQIAVISATPSPSPNSAGWYGGQFRRLGKNGGVIERAEVGQHQADAQDEAEVADAVDQEGLQVGEDRRRPGIPEADQQIGNQADGLPTEEQLHEVVAHHEHQHREGEQGDVAEEAVVAGIVLHVADGVDMHHQRNRGDHQHHGDRQLIDQETDLEMIVARRSATGTPGRCRCCRPSRP
jgi:hypothetical protein